MSIYDELAEAGAADIYTDAPECEEAVEALQNLIHNAAAQGRRDERDAARYRYLRNRNSDSIGKGKIFSGLKPENVVIDGDHLDAGIDAAIRLKSAPAACVKLIPTWTVLLSRPDYIAEDQFDTYMTHVEAEAPPDAVKIAQAKAYEHDYDEHERVEGIGKAADYLPLLVIEGKHADVKP